MSGSPNKLIRFWQELKRRKTGKVIIAYAATAFILLQLADILTPALLLPEWTTRLITLILIIGFPIAVIFSWVFDITPEGIKKTESIEVSESKKIVTTPAKRIFKISNIIIVALIIVVGILAYPRIFKRNTLEKMRSSGERISVAVMPFQNMTNDTTKNFWQEMIQENLITSLSGSEELKVRQPESIITLLKNNGAANYASITPSLASSVSHRLNANIFIYGNINQINTIVRINVKLIDSGSEEVFKSFQLDGIAENILLITDSLSGLIKNFLILSEMKQRKSIEQQLPLVSVNSPEAYKNYILAKNAFAKMDYTIACDYFSRALEIEPDFTFASIMLTWAYANQGKFEKAKECHLKAYYNKDHLPMHIKIKLLDQHAQLFEGYGESIKYLKQLPEYDDQDPHNYSDLGYVYNCLGQYNLAIPELEKALEIYKKWNSKPFWVVQYNNLGYAYHQTGQLRKEKRLYTKAEKDFPENSKLIYRQAVLALSESNPKDANEYIEKYISIAKNNLWPEADIMTDVGRIFSEADILNKAGEYYRKALSLEPEEPDKMNVLGYFLIDKDQNTNEGLELVERALELSPENYNYLHSKGWGLFKQGKYKEALDILQKSWDIRREKAIYDQEAFLHLEAAKKAVAGLKNN